MQSSPHQSQRLSLQPPTAYPRAVRYLATIILVGVALVIRFLIAPAEAGLPFITFFPTTALAAILFGFGPGLLAAILGSIIAGFFYLPPIREDTFTLWSQLVFLGDAALVCWAVNTMHRYREHYDKALDSSLAANMALEREIEERQQAENAVRERERELAEAQSIAHLGSWVMDLTTNRLTWSEEMYRIFGIPPEEFEGTYESFIGAVHPDDREAVGQAYMGSLVEGGSYDVEYRIIRRCDSALRWGHARCEHQRDSKGQVLRSAGTVLDITERKIAENAFRESEQRWKFALEGAGDGVWDWNIETDEVLFSRRWKEMLGYADNEVGHGFDAWRRLVHPDDLAPAMATIQAYFDGQSSDYVLEHRLLCKDGSWKWILSRGIATHRNTNGKPTRMIGTHSDITERKQATMQISFMAFHDRLTGLPNRSLFFDRFSQAISQARRNKKHVALLFIDLDGFKLVNDNYGHDAGDIVLNIIADRLLSSVRAMDTVARMGGDEFVVMLGELDSPDEATPVANKLLESVALPIQLPDDHMGTVGASIGISIYPDNGTEMDTLLSCADTAMYQSKHGGRGKYTYCTAPNIAEENANAWLHFDDAHIVGVAEIDQDHQQLAIQINHLNKAIKDKSDDATIRNLFDELIQSTKDHYDREKALMERYHYPRLLAHNVEHGRLLSEISQFKTRLHRGGDLFVLQSIKDWLLLHILTEDKPLGDFIRQEITSTHIN